MEFATKTQELFDAPTSNKLEFGLADIPDYVMKIAAMEALELTLRILRQPGGREMLDAETALRKANQKKQ